MINVTKSYEPAFFQTYLKNGNKENIIELTDTLTEVIFKSKIIKSTLANIDI